MAAALLVWKITTVQLADQQTRLCLWQKSLLLTEAVVNKKNKCSMLNELECCALFCVL